MKRNEILASPITIDEAIKSDLGFSVQCGFYSCKHNKEPCLTQRFAINIRFKNNLMT